MSTVIARRRSRRSNPGGGAACEGRAAYRVAAPLLDCFALASLALAMTDNAPALAMTGKSPALAVTGQWRRDPR